MVGLHVEALAHRRADRTHGLHDALGFVREEDGLELDGAVAPMAQAHVALELGGRAPGQARVLPLLLAHAAADLLELRAGGVLGDLEQALLVGRGAHPRDRPRLGVAQLATAQ